MWLMCLVGICGMQRLYLGQTGLGLAMLFTFGFCGIGQLFDVFLIPQTVARVNEQNDDQTLPTRTAKIKPRMVTKSSSSPSQASPSTTVDAASMDELDSLMKQAENALEKTQSTPNDHHGS